MKTVLDNLKLTKELLLKGRTLTGIMQQIEALKYVLDLLS
jgi:hypothetical protein